MIKKIDEKHDIDYSIGLLLISQNGNGQCYEMYQTSSVLQTNTMMTWARGWKMTGEIDK